MNTNRNDRNSGKDKKEQTKANATSQDFDRLAEEAEQEQKKKPGSQSNSSKQRNNGRGGGK